MTGAVIGPYVTDSLRERLNLKIIRTESLIIKRFASDEGLVKNLDVVQICIKGKTCKINIYIEALCIPHICSPLKNPIFEFVKEKYGYLKGLELAEYFPAEDVNHIEMLIGLDYYYSIVTGKTVRGPPNSPVAIESILCWIICGPTDIKSVEKTTRVNFISTSSDNTEHDDVLRNELKHFWEVESYGFDKENDVYDSFMNDIKFDGDRYITKLPFKPHADILPDNYRHSMQRLNSLKKKLDKNKELKESYHEIINSYEKSGIVEKVDSPGEPGKVHYLPQSGIERR